MNWQEKLVQRQRAVQRLAETEDGIVVFEWLRATVCHAGVCSMPDDADPIKLAFNTGRKAVWEMIQIEIDKPETDLIREAAQLERQQGQHEADLIERGLLEEGEPL